LEQFISPVKKQKLFRSIITTLILLYSIETIIVPWKVFILYLGFQPGKKKKRLDGVKIYHGVKIEFPQLSQKGK